MIIKATTKTISYTNYELYIGEDELSDLNRYIKANHFEHPILTVEDLHRMMECGNFWRDTPILNTTTHLYDTIGNVVDTWISDALINLGSPIDGYEEYMGIDEIEYSDEN